MIVTFLLAFMSSLLESDNFDEYTSELQSAALKATRNVLALPSDIGFHRSMDTDFSKDLDIFSSRVLSLTNRLLALVDGKGKLSSQDDVLDSFHSLVVDSIDQVLERTVCTLRPTKRINANPAGHMSRPVLWSQQGTSHRN